MPKIVIFIFFILLNISVNSYGKDEYFRTLRNDTVNLRQGPSFDYPVKIFYKKKFLPVLIQDKYYNYKKIKDHENNTGWIHVSQLSKKRAAIVYNENIVVFKNPTLYSKPLVVLNQGRLCLIIKCRNKWCKIKVDKYKGWVQQSTLWGRLN
jgi:SH3-like domain-containing protein